MSPISSTLVSSLPSEPSGTGVQTPSSEATPNSTGGRSDSFVESGGPSGSSSSLLVLPTSDSSSQPYTTVQSPSLYSGSFPITSTSEPPFDTITAPPTFTTVNNTGYVVSAIVYSGSEVLTLTVIAPNGTAPGTIVLAFPARRWVVVIAQPYTGTSVLTGPLTVTSIPASGTDLSASDSGATDIAREPVFANFNLRIRLLDLPDANTWPDWKLPCFHLTHTDINERSTSNVIDFESGYSSGRSVNVLVIFIFEQCRFIGARFVRHEHILTTNKFTDTERFSRQLCKRSAKPILVGYSLNGIDFKH
ncbi:hypothetical protein PRZ48_009596 [Zasmidium cellare]|uniref:Uncharacterized protein n=1 Tax=Zasmidium cellare TaxID=395010 RepID=A0ABR0EC53_ZASCE|nr:hypothetical protein PRZ48_009596 [Zasmidium cellare]